MFKKSDILPAILASASTLGVLVIAYGLLTKVTSISKNTDNQSEDKKVTVAAESTSNIATSKVSFSAPGIVPMGISIKINGATNMEKINKLLKKSFQQEFPGTTVTVDADGSVTGMRLLLSGQIDLAAIARPLDDEEIAQGLTAVTIDGKHIKDSNLSDTDTLFYAYREPANSKVEAFLGHLFSELGQEVILNP